VVSGGLGCCGGVAGDYGEVLRDCGGGETVCVVGAEAEDGDFGEGCAGDVVEGWDPFFFMLVASVD
jgi:hypothetical protein